MPRWLPYGKETRLLSLGPQIDYNFENRVALKNTGKDDKFILEW